MYNKKYNDVLCCLKIIDIDLFKSLNIQSKGFSFEVETLAKLSLKGIRIKEFLVGYNRRSKAQGKKIKLSHSVVILRTIFKIRFN